MIIGIVGEERKGWCICSRDFEIEFNMKMFVEKISMLKNLK